MDHSWTAMFQVDYHMLSAPLFSGKRKGDVQMMNSPLTAHKNLHLALEKWLLNFLFRTVLFLIPWPECGKGMKQGPFIWPGFLCSGYKLCVDNWVDISFLFNLVVIHKIGLPNFNNNFNITIFSVVNLHVMYFHREDVLLRAARREYCTTCHRSWGSGCGSQLHTFCPWRWEVMI